MKRTYLTIAVLALSTTPALAGGGADGYGASEEVHKLIMRLIELFTG